MKETPTLSPEMQLAFDAAKANGGKLIRFPGGFWYGHAAPKLNDRSFGTTTANALVRRGFANWSAWQKNARGEFPIELTLGSL